MTHLSSSKMRHMIVQSESTYWNFAVFSMIIQYYRLITGFIDLIQNNGARHLGNNQWENNLGYISHHFPSPNLLYILPHYIGALIWIPLLLIQKAILYKIAHESREVIKYRYWRLHSKIGYILTFNLIITLILGIYSANTQMIPNVRFYFYLIGVSGLITMMAGIYYARRKDYIKHRLCFMLCMELPVVMSLWTEWFIALLQKVILDPTSGEFIGLWTAFFILPMFFSIKYISDYNRDTNHLAKE